MATKAPTPGTAGVNAAHGANSQAESFQDNTGSIPLAEAKVLYRTALERTRIAGKAHSALEVAVIAAESNEAKAAVRERMSAATIEREWNISITEDLYAWKVLSRSSTRTRAEMIEKIQLCLAPDFLECSGLGDEAVGLLDAINRDLQLPTQDDTTILAAFDSWRENKRIYLTTPDGDPSECDKLGFTPEQNRLWDKTNAAEAFIYNAVAKTPRGVSVLLQMALHSMNGTAEVEALLVAGDLTAVAASDELDGNDRLIVAAVQALETMEA